MGIGREAGREERETIGGVGREEKEGRERIGVGSVADADPDPDPYPVGSGLFWSPGSGSGKIPNPDPDPLSTKRPHIIQIFSLLNCLKYSFVQIIFYL